MTDESETPSEQDRNTTGSPVDPLPGTPLSCRPSLEELYRYMDGFLDADRLAAMRSHLDTCGGCDELYHIQAGFRHLIEMRCRQTQLPPDLAQRVFRAITELK